MKTILLVTVNTVLNDESLVGIRKSLLNQAREGLILTDERFKVNLINVDLEELTENIEVND